MSWQLFLAPSPETALYEGTYKGTLIFQWALDRATARLNMYPLLHIHLARSEHPYFIVRSPERLLQF